MIQINLKSTLIQMDFSFFAVIAFFLMTDGGMFGFSAILACALHETSHLIMMIIFAIPVDMITFYGAGIRITSSQIQKATSFRRSIVLLAGSLGNFIFAAVLLLFGEQLAALINLFTGLFNLLPIGEYDGAALLKSFAIKHFKAENVDLILKIAGIASAVICVFLVVFFTRGFSLTLISTIVYLIFAWCFKITPLSRQ